jgi:DNA-binding response OmpR family regulator
MLPSPSGFTLAAILREIALFDPTLIAGRDADLERPAEPMTSRIRVLIVEDEPTLALSLHEGLQSLGLNPVVVESAQKAWEQLWSSTFDLIVLDVGLPEGAEAGFVLARDLRQSDFRQPILFLTAREALSDRIRGLEHGDDYLTKPFALTEVVARLKALYRRGEMRPLQVKWADVELWPDTRTVKRAESLLRLTGKEYEVLELFMLNPGRVFTRHEILERIWGASYDGASNLVDVYVKNLRAKVAEGIIETIRGLGYRFPG